MKQHDKIVKANHFLNHIISRKTKAIFIGSVVITFNLICGVMNAQEDEERSPDALPTSTATSLNKGSLPSTFGTANNEKITILPPGVVEKNYEGTSDLQSISQIRKKLIDEAINKISEEILTGILGEARYKKNRKVISEKIIKQSGRYIPVLKTSELTPGVGGQKMTVTMHVNTKIMETLLQEQGLLFENEGNPILIPFLSFEDHIHGEDYRWWKQKNSTSLQIPFEFLEDQLQKQLFTQGFFVQRPSTSKMNLLMPLAFQQDLLTPEQIYKLAEKWGYPLVLIGNLSLIQNTQNDSLLELQVAVHQVSTGRVMAQLYRQQKVSKNINLDSLALKNDTKKHLGFIVQAFKDLGQQMLEAWQRGVLTSTLVRLEIQGGLPLNKYDLFKESLKQSSRTIRQVRERMIATDSVMFELEINGAVGDLTSTLNQIKVGDQIYKLKGMDSKNTLIYQSIGKF